MTPTSSIHRGDAPARAGRRLTRRGRLLVLLTVAAALFGVFSLGRVSSSADEPGGPTVRQVTVTPGDTLWQVAQRVAPQDDPRVTVRRLMDLNHLSSVALRAGQTLLLPAGVQG